MTARCGILRNDTGERAGAHNSQTRTDGESPSEFKQSRTARQQNCRLVGTRFSGGSAGASPSPRLRPVGHLLPTGAKEISPATSEFDLIRVNLCSSVANSPYFFRDFRVFTWLVFCICLELCVLRLLCGKHHHSPRDTFSEPPVACIDLCSSVAKFPACIQ